MRDRARAAAFDIPLERPARPKTKDPGGSTAAALAVLRLEKFAASAVVDFGTTAVGSLALQMLTIVNPGPAPVRVTLERRLPANFAVGLETTPEGVEIAAGDSHVTRVSWLPGEAGGVRETLGLRVNGKQRVNAIIVGRAEEVSADAFPTLVAVAVEQPAQNPPAAPRVCLAQAATITAAAASSSGKYRRMASLKSPVRDSRCCSDALQPSCGWCLLLMMTPPPPHHAGCWRQARHCRQRWWERPACRAQHQQGRRRECNGTCR